MYIYLVHKSVGIVAIRILLPFLSTYRRNRLCLINRFLIEIEIKIGF